MALRLQDPLPAWITHIALVQEDNIITGPRHSTKFTALGELTSELTKKEASARRVSSQLNGEELVSMKDVNVAYHDRHVCSFASLLK